MRCNKCSQELEADSKFCPFCGARIMASNGSQPQIIRIGRSKSNDFVLDHGKVSSRHCQLSIYGDGNYVLEDLGSTNGIYVNGRKVQIQRVGLTDKVTLGRDVPLDLARVIGSASRPAVREPVTPPGGIDLRAKSDITIGREEGNDIVVRNIRVSRHHARLMRSGPGWELSDLGSANGTFVNGRRVTKALITERDSIVVGGVPLDLESLFRQRKQDWNADLNLLAQDLSFRVPEKIIVDDINLRMCPGQFIGLIGPSGCGKTTLMMMLNGYLRPSRGSVLLNGVSLHHNLQSFQGQLGYVPQDDIIHRELTVRESLDFTSQLRLGRQIPAGERQRQISHILDSLGLSATENTLIGSPEKKGISGGQRKRVNMAQELITEPQFFFLDEPTSGLDPRSDREVMKLLGEISDNGHLVLLTTHNIDAVNFAILSHLIVIAPGGRLAYYGPSSEVLSYFGVQNPEDIFEVLEKRDPDGLKDRYMASRYYSEYSRPPDRELAPRAAFSDTQGLRKGRSDAFHQFLVLCRRAFLVKTRDVFSAAVLLLQAPIIGLFTHLVFKDAENISSLFFVLVIAAIWLGCSNSAREIVTEQSIFRREQKASLSIDAYLWSKLCVLALLCLVQCLILTGFAAITMDLSFFELFGVLSLVSITSLSMGLALSAVVKTGETAMALVPVALIPQVILGGLIVPFGNIPEAVKALAGLMLSRWSFELLLVLHDDSLLTESIGFNMDNLGPDIAVMAAMCIFFIILTRVALKRKVR
ncbi:MAG TPA: FHA domain-containing protein [Candidatus Cloacimonadota bacterium]|nr:FHA domain-containing protein [Candidatus Cloacimonadota bacterium]HOH79175.1 FHA domain-containing protein [Candidatus Cloacimonadota bacterium]